MCGLGITTLSRRGIDCSLYDCTLTGHYLPYLTPSLPEMDPERSGGNGIAAGSVSGLCRSGEIMLCTLHGLENISIKTAQVEINILK